MHGLRLSCRNSGAPMLLALVLFLQGICGTWGQRNATKSCLLNPSTFVSHAKGFQGKRFVVAVHVVPPFVMYDDKKSGNTRFQGITVDLLEALSKELKFSYVLVLADLNRPTTSQAPLDAVQYKWQYPGVGIADFAGGAIRIASNRSEALQFTLPFYDSGFQLIVQPPPDPINPTGFFDPFHESLWMMVVFEMIVVAIACYYMEAPTCDPPVNDADDLAIVPGKSFGCWDSLYWSLTLLIQIPDKAPCTWGGKVVLIAHGWFMLICVASYTANLANFLTTSNMAESLTAWSQVQESFGQYKIALPRGSAHESYINVQQEMYGHEYNITWTRTHEDAFALLEDGAVDATFHDEPIAQAHLQTINVKACRLIETGKMFASFGYGFAFPFDNPDFIAFSQAIVYLKENGEMRRIIRKYGVGPDGSRKEGELDCSMSGSSDGDESFHLYDMAGLLYMTAIVVMLGFLINFWERWSHDKAALPCLQPCQDCCCPKPLDIADDDEEGYGGGPLGRRWRRDSEESDDLMVENGVTPLTAALAEGVKKGILEAIAKMSEEGLTHPSFTAGMSGVEMMEHAGFVDTPRGLAAFGAAAEKVPGVGLLFGGLSSVGEMVGVSSNAPAEGSSVLSPRRPYSQPPKKTVSGAVSVDTSDAGSRIGAFSPTLEPKMPRAPRGLDDVEEEDGDEKTDETAVGEHHYNI